MISKSHIHFVGIGGIGMSGIAKILRSMGHTISGCDVDHEQKSILDLKQLGCTIHHGNDTPACQDPSIDILVYSTAINQASKELIHAQERGISTIHRSLMLAELMRTHFSIAVSGSHGKTTTSSLIAHILLDAGLDPTVIVGGHLQSLDSNAHAGSGKFIVVESDESDRSFLRLHPTIAVVTNIDLEHLETYTDIEDIKDTFKKFLARIPFYGKAVLCADDANVRSILPLDTIRPLLYGIDYDANIRATELSIGKDTSHCSVRKNGTLIGELTINLPGKHNVLNALAAVTVALELGVSFTQCAHALKTFMGVDRRFTFKGLFKGATLIDDYGHHPTEILNTLEVARKKTSKKLIVVFQPHRYSRTEKLWNQFVDLFSSEKIDELIITDIYPASENPIQGITTENLLEAIQKKNPSLAVQYIPAEKNWASLISYLTRSAQEGDLILLQGAGKVNTVASLLTSL